jgi:hypothetical protein
MMIAMFWVVEPCSLLKRYRRFKRTFILRHQLLLNHLLTRTVAVYMGHPVHMNMIEVRIGSHVRMLR